MAVIWLATYDNTHQSNKLVVWVAKVCEDSRLIRGK